MTSSGASPSTLARFLGERPVPETPATLLNLAPGERDEARIIAALQAALRAVATHPESMTPEADAVRHALHAAASALMTARRPESPSAPAAASTPPREFVDEVRLALARARGWNRESMNRVAALSRAFGVSDEAAIELVRSLATPAAPVPAPVPGATVLAAPLRRPSADGASTDAAVPAGEDPSVLNGGDRAVKTLVVAGGIGAVAIVALLVGAFALMLSPRRPSPPPGVPAPNITGASPQTAARREYFPAPAAREPSVSAPPSAKTDRVGDWEDLVREVAASSAALDLDPAAAAARFAEVVSRMADSWTAARPDEVVASVDAIIEFVYRAAASPDAERVASDALCADAERLRDPASVEADRIGRVAWSAGVTARLSRERDLSTALRRRVQAASDAAGGPGPGAGASFRAGASGALALMAGRLVPNAEGGDADAANRAVGAWQAWRRAVDASEGRNSAGATRATLIAVDGLLRSGAEPTQSRPVLDSVGALVASIPWRATDESRGWLLRWFDSDEITAGDLYAVTIALATRSGAEGVDPTMIVGIGALAGDRADLRGRYQTVWNMSPARSRDSLIGLWLEAAASQPAPQPDAAPVVHLARAVALARLNSAAARLWAGEVDGVDAAIRDPTSGLPVAGPSGGVTPAPPSSESSWAVSYLAARQNIPTRREILSRVASPLTAMEAEVLAEEALRGSPAQVRADARAIIARGASEATVVNALLEAAPLMPQTLDNATLVEAVSFASLPPLRDARWRVAVRRALVERLLQVAATGTQDAAIDTLSSQLSESYGPIAPFAAGPGDAPSSTSPPPDSAAGSAPPADPDPIEESARRRVERLLADADGAIASGREPISLARVRTSLGLRRRLAEGRIQAFAAEQVGAAEAMSFVTVAEHPARAPAAAATLDRLAAVRRRAGHVFEQIAATERAILELWTLRLAERISS